MPLGMNTTSAAPTPARTTARRWPPLANPAHLAALLAQTEGVRARMELRAEHWAIVLSERGEAAR